MAAQNTPYAKVQAFYGAVLAEGFQCVLGASGGETTSGRCERAYAELIEFNQNHKGENQYFLEPVHCIAFSIAWTAAKISSEEAIS